MTEPAPPEDNGRTKQIRADIRDALTNLPDAYATLSLFILPGSAPPDPDMRTGTTSPARTPLRLEVLDLLDEREKADAEAQRLDYDLDRRAGARRQGVLPTLTSWVRLVDGELWDEGIEHKAPDDNPTVAGECSWILGHLHWISEQQWADELAGDAMSMFDDVRKATGWTPDATLACIRCGWHVTERDNGAWFTCTGCNTSWSRMELHRMAERRKPKTLAECALMAGVTERTLRKYKAEGRIVPVSKRGTADLYLYEDIHEATMRLRYRSS